MQRQTLRSDSLKLASFSLVAVECVTPESCLLIRPTAVDFPIDNNQYQSNLALYASGIATFVIFGEGEVASCGIIWLGFVEFL